MPLDESDLFPDAPKADPVRRIRSASTQLRQLRNRVGHDGLTPAAARTLIDEITKALDACAKALESAADTTGSDP